MRHVYRFALAKDEDRAQVKHGYATLRFVTFTFVATRLSRAKCGLLTGEVWACKANGSGTSRKDNDTVWIYSPEVDGLYRSADKSKREVILGIGNTKIDYLPDLPRMPRKNKQVRGKKRRSAAELSIAKAWQA